MSHRVLLALAAVLAAAACTADAPVAPPPPSARTAGVARPADDPRGFDRRDDDDRYGWMGRLSGSSSARGQLTYCQRRAAAADSALIGPRGGILVVGGDQLVVPPGALRSPTLIKGFIPADTLAMIHLEPTGLQFAKPAGLLLDVSGCMIDDANNVYYVDELGKIIERIDVLYSPFWHRVAAPIWHFSGYAIAL